MDISTGKFLSINQMAGQVTGLQKEKEAAKSPVSFQDVFSGKAIEQNGLKFSKHASIRMSDRGMEMTVEQKARLENGARMAAEKGIKDSLVLIDNMAFIVNAPNQTVITAMNSAETMENVFTNINGAVIM